MCTDADVVGRLPQSQADCNTICRGKNRSHESATTSVCRRLSMHSVSTDGIKEATIDIFLPFPILYVIVALLYKAECCVDGPLLASQSDSGRSLDGGHASCLPCIKNNPALSLHIARHCTCLIIHSSRYYHSHLQSNKMKLQKAFLLRS